MLSIFQAVIVRSTEVQTQRSDSDSNSTGSFDINSSNHSNQRNSPSVDSGCHSDWNFRQRSITPIDKNSSETGIINRLDGSESLKRLDSTGGSSGIHSEKGSLQRLESTGSYTEIVDTESGELEIIRLPKHVKGHKHKKKKKKPHEEADKISKFDKNKFSIEIPPIDEIKFEDTIMNYQNNNLESSSSDFSLSSDLRSPGDGHEESENLTVGSINKSATLRNANSIDDKDNTDSSVKVGKQNPPDKANVISDKLKSDQSLETIKNVGGSSQEMLKARVSNIVDKGKVVNENAKVCDIVDSAVKTVEMSHDVNYSVQRNKDTQNVQYDSVPNLPDNSGLFKAGLDAIIDETRPVDPHLYSGSPVHDNEDPNSELTVKENVDMKIESICYGGPSIYSNEHDNDTFSDENDDNSVNYDFKKNSNSTPVKEIDQYLEVLTDKTPFDYANLNSENQEVDIYSLNYDLESSGSTDAYGTTKLTKLVGHATPSHTPSPTNQRLYGKLTNHSSSVLPNPITGTARQSPNQVEAYRASPNQRTDTESQRSDDSKSVCSTVSSDVELQGKNLTEESFFGEVVDTY